MPGKSLGFQAECHETRTVEKNGPQCLDKTQLREKTDQVRRVGVRPVGVEPTTYGFEVRHSIQLSYGRHEILV